MRNLIVFALMIALIGNATAIDLGAVQNNYKDNHHVGTNPGTPDGRDGGEDVGSAVVIESLPYSDTGNTSDNIDDYDSICPYSGSTSADEVYSYTPAFNAVISVDLCGSSYDTKTYVLDNSMNEVACNDDFYFDATCGQYVSFIEEAFLTGGETYFIVIDGYGGDAGDYILAVEEYEAPPPCIIDIDDDEGEPALVDGYLDAFNGGCNSPEFGNPFSYLEAEGGCMGTGELTLGGYAGWFINADGSHSRDTDWFIGNIGWTGILEWTLDAEQETYGYLLGPNDCDTVFVVDLMLVGPCAPLTMTIQGAPGDIVWLWVGSSSFNAPPGFVGQEYPYQCYFDGLLTPVGVTPTDKITFDGIKSLYR